MKKLMMTFSLALLLTFAVGTYAEAQVIAMDASTEMVKPDGEEKKKDAKKESCSKEKSECCKKSCDDKKAEDKKE